MTKASPTTSPEEVKKKVDEVVATPSNGAPPRRRMSPLKVNMILGGIAGFFSLLSVSPFMIIYLINQAPPAVYTVRKVLTPKVHPGEKLIIRIAADVPQGCSATVNRVIVDASTRRHGFDPVPRPNEPEYDVELTTPIEAVPGPAYYSGRVEWSCNWLQRWWPQSVLQKNIPFIILPTDKTLPELQQELAPHNQDIPRPPPAIAPEPESVPDPMPPPPPPIPYQEGAIPTETVDPGIQSAQSYDDNAN